MTEYKGYRIVRKDFDNPIDCHGFEMTSGFCIVDEFDDAALPINQTYFWSPQDACEVIDAVELLRTHIDKRRWPTTIAYEINIILGMRRRFGMAFDVFRQIKREVKDAEDFDENPSKKILGLIQQLELASRS